MKPLARRDGLVIRDLGDEILVYDRERHRAHCLNSAAASVFRLCDGERGADELAAMLGAPADPRAREALAALALGQLSEAQLLADVAGAAPAATVPAEGADLRRRDLLRRVGTALLLPAIVSIVAPTPAQAASAQCITADDCFNDQTGNYLKRCSYFGGGGGCHGTDCGTCGAVVSGACEQGGPACPYP
jgi:hypothetical protein